MINITDEHFDDIIFRNIETDEIIDIKKDDFINIRVKVPAKYDFQTSLTEQGFFHADRMLKVSINLRKIKSGNIKIRQNVIKTNDYKDEIIKISSKSFPVDRRFNINREYNDYISNKIIMQRIDDLNDFYVVLFKDIPVGFAGVDEIEKDIYEIKLAAVDEKYRMTGAALSLYSYLIDIYSKQNGKQLIGWISTVNMAVMNLYSSLGAVFSEPSDIFIWERE